MAANTINFTTGPATLPDVGTLSYNGCTFSPLFESNVSGNVVKDNARRTVKLMEYVLEVDGYVTAPDELLQGGIAQTMSTVEAMLTAQAGILTYQGRGFDFKVNAQGNGGTFNGAARDVAWGPVPEMLEFKPLGGGLSAKIKWKVTFRVFIGTGGSLLKAGGGGNQPLLQFNCETSVSYGEDYFSTLSIRGTMEIALTRLTVGDRIVKNTVDAARSQLDTRIFSGIDLSRFRVVRREYPVSRDKRTMEFDVVVEEKPYMDLPPGCTIARGSYSVRPSKMGAGLANWMCTLRATYTVRADQPRRVAWFAFLALLRLRLSNAVFSVQNFRPQPDPSIFNEQGTIAIWEALVGKKPLNVKNAWIVDFSVDEGLYLDSKTTSFSASWKLTTNFEGILIASGLWRKVAEVNKQSNNLWAMSMKDVSGTVSWLQNKLDPSLDVIVDFGGG